MGLPIAVQQSSDLECSIFFLHIPGGKKMLALKMQTADTSAGGDKVAEKAVCTHGPLQEEAAQTDVFEQSGCPTPSN